MSSRARLAYATMFAFTLGACEQCGGDDGSVAELLEKSGTVQHDLAAEGDDWQAADLGARFAIGDGIRTRSASEAVLRLGRNGGRLQLQANTTIRFMRQPNQATSLQVSTGEAVVDVGDAAFTIGSAVVDPGSRIRLRSEQLTVMIGRAVLDDQVANEGDILELRFGDAVPDDPPQPPPDTDPDPVPPVADPPPVVDAPPAAAGIVVARRSGRGSQLRAPDGEWRTIGSEDLEVAPGSRIRVPSRASVVLRRGGSESVLQGRGEYVVSGDAESLVRATSGNVTVNPGASEVAIAVPGGSIVVRGENGETRLNVGGRRGTEVRVVRGSADVNGERDTDTLLAGEMAVLTRQGELNVGGRGPTRADFFVSAGASVTVHDPRPPTAVGIRFGEVCEGRGVVELLRGRSSVAASSAGDGHANLLVTPGAHSYRVRCAGGESQVASGTIRVMRDSGIAPLPPSAPRSVVDADGRTYRVLYQTHLPDITVRWPRPPGSGPYVLTVRPASGEARTFSSSSPRVELASGTFNTGTYRLTFASGETRSRETTLEIRFDNAMPTASIRAPADRSFAAGETVRVAGIAVPGWTASVGGVALELDPQLRFEGNVSVPADQGALAIELRHASRGRHFYLRRPRSGGP